MPQFEIQFPFAALQLDPDEFRQTKSEPHLSSLRGLEIAQQLHEKGKQLCALRALADLAEDMRAHQLVEPWMVFEVLALKCRILQALGKGARVRALAKPALHWLLDARTD